MLHWARNTAGSGTPIFGVNIGGMGFLTAASGKDLAKAFKAIAAGEFKIEPRTLLSAKGQNGDGKIQLKAMNDIVISRGSAPRMIRVEVKVDGEVLTVYRCDGLVISTSTGSTAYSAAGGAIVAPSRGHLDHANLPHTLSNRPDHQPAIDYRGANARSQTRSYPIRRRLGRGSLEANSLVVIRRNRQSVKLRGCRTVPFKTLHRNYNGCNARDDSLERHSPRSRSLRDDRLEGVRDAPTSRKTSCASAISKRIATRQTSAPAACAAIKPSCLVCDPT